MLLRQVLVHHFPSWSYGGASKRIEMDYGPNKEALEMVYEKRELEDSIFYIGYNKDYTLWSFCFANMGAQGACGGRFNMADGTIDHVRGAWSGCAVGAADALGTDDPFVEVVVNLTVYHTRKSVLGKFGVALKQKVIGGNTYWEAA